jgi:hypothetical protein
MQTHVDVLGWLHTIWGALGLLTGVSLWILALGTRGALGELGLVGPAGQAAVTIFVVCGALLVVCGVAMVLTGRALRSRRRGGRWAALVLAIPNLIVVPFGTALGIYALWVLLNDEARAEFGRPSRAAARLARAARPSDSPMTR